MATGYDSRQQAKDSFAFTPNAPAQANTGLSGRSNSAQVIGGQSQGGVGLSSAPTQAAPTNFGAMIDDIVEPYVQKHQKARFYEGFNKAQTGVALDELDKSNKGLKSIFGPNSFEEGAQFYAGQKAIADHQQWVMDNQDDLKVMDPNESARAIAENASTHMTGHNEADMQIQSGIIQATGPLMATTAKNRFVYQQDQAVRSLSSAWRASGSALQAIQVQNAGLSSPDDEVTGAAQQSLNQFVGSIFPPPEGMTTESYHSALTTFLLDTAQSGNGYAVKAIQDSGLLNTLPDDKRVKLEDAIGKYANRAMAPVAMEMGPRIDALHFKQQFGKISAEDAMAEAKSINDEVKRRTGFDVDLFDWKEVVGEGKTVWSNVHSALTRQEDRKWQLEDQAARDKFELDKAAADAAGKAAQISAAWGAGGVKQSLALGIGTGNNYDVLAQQDYAQGNLTRITQAYKTDGWVSGLVSSGLKSNIEASIGTEYNKDFEAGFQRFKAFNDANPAMAAAYTGDLYLPLMAYKSLSATMSPSLAFAKAMDPSRYGGAKAAPATKEAKTAIAEYVSGQNARTIWGTNIQINPFSRKNLNTSGLNAMQNVLGRQLDLLSANSDVPAEQLVPQLEEQALKNGSFERYGPLAWSNRQGTENLGTSLHLQQDEADEVIPAVVNEWLTKAGHSDGAYGDNYDIRRIKDGNGVTALAVQPVDDEGYHPPVIIPLSAFTAASARTRADRVAKGQAEMAAKANVRFSVVPRVTSPMKKTSMLLKPGGAQ
ncbi:hypothetical protein [Aquisediminimonas sediminicola]|uniref:hypothetical protein n=1 Tax=Alteraquisediminimonas sediminicola TaxID=2676787 RepID=UPI001C8ECDFE|nr:hypothetical protein [Aquisediminimonas sediminicola]